MTSSSSSHPVFCQGPVVVRPASRGGGEGRVDRQGGKEDQGGRGSDPANAPLSTQPCPYRSTSFFLRRLSSSPPPLNNLFHPLKLIPIFNPLSSRIPVSFLPISSLLSPPGELLQFRGPPPALQDIPLSEILDTRLLWLRAKVGHIAAKICSRRHRLFLPLAAFYSSWIGNFLLVAPQTPPPPVR